MNPVAGAHALAGTVLLLAPGRVLSVLEGRRPGRAGLLVARVLGARHAGQALVLAAHPDLAGWGAAVDALHGASMAAWAGGARPRRRAATASALVAALLALAEAAQKYSSARVDPGRCRSMPW